MRRSGRLSVGIVVLGVAMVAVALVPGSSIAQQSDAPHDGLLRDAQAYASIFRVSVDEAVARFALQDAAGDLDAELAEKEPATFGGLWIEHEPAFRVIVLFTSGGNATLAPYVQGTDMAKVVEVREARRTLTQLQADQAAVSSLAPAGVDFATSISVFENRVEIQTASPDAYQAFTGLASQLPESAVVVQVEDLPSPVADIYGGLPLSNGCTTGFSLEQTNGSLEGVTTAGHCSNATSYNGTNLPWQAGQQSGSADAQWHTTPRLGDPNLINDGSGTRTITARTSRTNQAVGTIVCKFGRTTGYGCGTLWDKSYMPGTFCVNPANATWMLVNPVPAGPDLAEVGDSGGPVFVGNTAYGTINCQIGLASMIYMAQNYLSNIGVRVDIT
ncbi:MAG: hypothetical protein ACT4PO_09930 [Actinomycetota bacterium]